MPYGSPRRYQRRHRSPAPKMRAFTLGPIKGVRESQDPTAEDAAEYAADLVNMLLVAGDPALRARPAFERVNYASAIAGNTIQGFAFFAPSSGSQYPVVFANGKLYKLTWYPSAAYAPTLTDITPTGVTISATAPVSAVMLGGYLIWSDGVNKVVKWAGGATATYLTDGTAGSATGVAYGPLTVYYAKLFYIRDDNRVQLVWSEENTPDSGYLNSTYSNFWTLGQTEQEPLRAIVATNDCLYYFRANSIGAISGRVASDFSTGGGVHDVVSLSVGTTTPTSLAVVDDEVWFVDAGYRPHRIQRGAQEGRGVDGLWRDCQLQVLLGQAVGGVPLSTFAPTLYTAHVPEWDVVLMSQLPSSGASTQALVFQRSTGQYLGRWTPPTGAQMFALASIAGPNGERSLLMGDSNAGFVYRLTSPRELRGADILAGYAAGVPATPTPIATTIVFAPLMPGGNVRWDKAELVVRNESVSAFDPFALSVDYKTLRGQGVFSAAQTVASLEGQTIGGNSIFTAPGFDQPIQVGLAASDRALQLRVRQSTWTGGTLGTGVYTFARATVFGAVVDDDPIVVASAPAATLAWRSAPYSGLLASGAFTATVLVTDADGNPLANRLVGFSSANASVMTVTATATTDSTGLATVTITPAGAGGATLTAFCDAATGTTSVTITTFATLLAYHAGDSLASATFSRASAATYETNTLAVATASSGTVRDSDYDQNGVLRSVLLELQRTNVCTQSEDLTQSSVWTPSAVSVANVAVTNPAGGTTATKITEGASNALHFLYHVITLVTWPLSTTMIVTAFIKAAGRDIAELACTTATPGSGNGVVYDLTGSGAVLSVGGGSAVAAKIEAWGNGWYRTVTTFVQSATGSGTPNFFIVPCTRTPINDVYTGDGASGLYVWGVQAECQVTHETSYIQTAAATVSRAADSLALPLTGSAQTPQLSTWYADFTERGTVLGASGTTLWAITNAGFTGARLWLDTDGSGHYRLNHNNGTDATVSATLAAGPAMRDRVKLRAVLNADGSVVLFQSLNGAAETSTVTSAAPTHGLAGAWSANTLYLNSSGSSNPGAVALAAIKAATGVQTQAIMAAL